MRRDFLKRSLFNKAVTFERPHVAESLDDVRTPGTDIKRIRNVSVILRRLLTLGSDKLLNLLARVLKQADETRVEFAGVFLHHLLNLTPRKPFETRGLPMVLALRGEAELRAYGAQEIMVREFTALEYVSWLHGDA